MKNVSESLLNSPHRSSEVSQNPATDSAAGQVDFTAAAPQDNNGVGHPQSEVQPDSEKASQHLTFGTIALLIGLISFLGIICGPAAIVCGVQANKYGARTGGPVLIVLGILETVLALIGMAALQQLTQ